MIHVGNVCNEYIGSNGHISTTHSAIQLNCTIQLNRTISIRFHHFHRLHWTICFVSTGSAQVESCQWFCAPLAKFLQCLLIFVSYWFETCYRRFQFRLDHQWFGSTSISGNPPHGHYYLCLSISIMWYLSKDCRKGNWVGE